jgi:hypothetical protein
MQLSRLASLMRGLLFSPATREKLNQFCDWEKNDYEQPSPPFIKKSVLHRFGIPTGTWVETGTFQGDTTEFLRHKAKQVFTIEPDDALCRRALNRFNNMSNVQVLRGLSEDVLPELLPQVSGDVSFWLDGHYSGGITHQGSAHTPILPELEAIAINLNHFGRVSILIDDVRLFTYNKDIEYPHLDVLVDWARDQRMSWFIENDIFVMRRANE